MKKKVKLKKVLAIIFIALIFFNVFIPNIQAMTSTYNATEDSTTVDGNTNNMLNALTDIILPMVFPIVDAIATIVSKVMHGLTGSYNFPWSDRIVFNTIPFLDVNFINPEPGSLFMDASGNYSMIGKTVRGAYFSILGISVGFLGIAVAINVIKMLIATLPSAKARYKEMISATLTCLVLIFAMHYIMSFIFYINEQLVQVAADFSQNVLTSDTIEAANKSLTDAEDADSKKLVENFFDKCNHTSWWSPITIIKSLVKGAVNLVNDIKEWCANLGEKIKEAWDNFWGNDSDEDEKTMSRDDKNENGYYGKVFPTKQDFINYFEDKNSPGYKGDNMYNVAAYLLKDYFYRDAMLSMVAGNDTNKFTNAGLWGWAQSAANTVLWVTGVVDTGLQGLQNLYNSVCFVYNEVPNKHYPNITTAIGWEKEIERLKVLEEESQDDTKTAAYHIQGLYCRAYYRYIYDGEDKKELQSQPNIVQSMGDYFKRNIYYVDIEKGNWSPNTFDGIMCILYCVFVVQSFMFLFSYVKRLFYVVVLGMMGPATVVFDYIKKSY